MSQTRFQIKKMSDLEVLLPGFKAVWPKMKEACRTRQRCPKGVTFTDEPREAVLNDDESGKRFVLDLATMELSGGQHISGGEWAVHAGDNHDKPVVQVPTTHAVIVCIYSQTYFSMTVQVAKLSPQMGAGQ